MPAGRQSALVVGLVQVDGDQRFVDLHHERDRPRPRPVQFGYAISCDRVPRLRCPWPTSATLACSVLVEDPSKGGLWWLFGRSVQQRVNGVANGRDVLIIVEVDQDSLDRVNK